jgi:hypothetical protein
MLLFLTQALVNFCVGLLLFSKGGGDLIGNAPVSLIKNAHCLIRPFRFILLFLGPLVKLMLGALKSSGW